VPRPLRTEQRRTLLRYALLACGVSASLLPFATPENVVAQAAGELPIAHRATVLPSGALAYPHIDVARDPFVPAAAAVAPDGTQVPVGTGPLLVRAVVLGASPHALIDVAGREQILGIGDALLETTVTGIDERGVHLENGESLAYPQGQF
jgi:hypothetical protein